MITKELTERGYTFVNNVWVKPWGKSMLCLTPLKSGKLVRKVIYQNETVDMSTVELSTLELGLVNTTVEKPQPQETLKFGKYDPSEELVFEKVEDNN